MGTETSRNNRKFVAQNIEFQESVSTLSAENVKIKEENAELATLLGEYLKEKHNESSKLIGTNRKGISQSSNTSVNDISMDEPQGSSPMMYKSSTIKDNTACFRRISESKGENMGQVIIMEMKDDIIILNEEIKRLIAENQDLEKRHAENDTERNKLNSIICESDKENKELNLEIQKMR